jgi:hypothetical protein
MRTRFVVIGHELGKLSFKITSVPERYLVQELAADRSDESFDEGVRERHVRHGLDLFDIEDPQVRLPAMKLEQRIVIGAQTKR